MEKEKALLEMDFGELMELSKDGSVTKSTEDFKEDSDDTQVKKEFKEDDNLFDVDVGEILEGKDEVKKEEIAGKEEEDSSEKDSPDSGVKEEDEGDTKETKKTEDASGDPFTLVFARYQLEQGNLTELNEEKLKKIIEEEGESAAMAYLFKEEVEINRNAYLEQYENDAKELREYMELKDLGADTETAKKMVGDAAGFEKITHDELEKEDNEDLRKAVITQNYKNSTRFSDAKIKKLVDNTVSLGEDIEEAKEAIDNIKDFNKQRIAEEKERLEKERKEFEETHKQQLKNVREKIYSLDEVLPGHKINKQTKKKIEDMLLKPAGQDSKGNQINKIWQKRLDNPLDFDIKLAYLISTGYFDGKTDKIEKANKTRIVEDLEKHIKSTKDKPFSTKPPSHEEEADQDATDSLESMKRAFKL